jgi:hypothetical protein
MLRRVPATLRVAGIALIAVIAADAVLKHEHGISGDEPFYDRIAAHPGGAHSFPYAYRFAVPWLVHALPFSRTTSFTLLAWLAIAGSAAALYALMREFEIGERLATAFAIGFALSPPLLVVLLRHGRSIDPASVLVLTVGCLTIVRRQRLALSATILIGVAVRESSMYLIPLAYAVWAKRLLDREALKDTVLVGALPAIAYVLVRASIAAVGRQYIPGYTGSFLQNRWDIIKQGLSGNTLWVELRRLGAAFGPVWLAAPFAVRDLPFARRGLVLVALCVGSMTFAFDWGRIIFLAAPVFYVAAAYAVRDRRRLAALTVAGLLALDLGYAIYMQAYGVTHSIEPRIGQQQRVPVY